MELRSCALSPHGREESLSPSRSPRWRGGYIALASLGIALFLFGIFNVYFFTQTNHARRVQENALRAETQAAAAIAASDTPFGVASAIEGGLLPYLNRSDPVAAFLDAHAQNSLDCPTIPPVGQASARYLLYEGVSYSRGTCARFLNAVAQTAFGASPGSNVLLSLPRSRGSSGGAGENYPYQILSRPLRAAFIALAFRDGNQIPQGVGVSIERVRIYLLRPNNLAFPYPFWIHTVNTTTLPRSYPGAPGNIWNGPILFSGATGGGASSDGVYRSYDVAFAQEPASKHPAFFAMGIHLGGCTGTQYSSCAKSASQRVSQTQSSVRTFTAGQTSPPSTTLALDRLGGSPYAPKGTPGGVAARFAAGAGYLAEPYSSGDIFSPATSFLNALSPTRSYALYQNYTVELSAPANSVQNVRILNGRGNQVDSFTLSGDTVLFFPNAPQVSVRSAPNTVYALASQAPSLVILANANIRIESHLLARDPFCRNPAEAVRNQDGTVTLVETCGGPVPRQLFGLYSRNGNVALGFIDQSIYLNQVFVLAPNGAFRLDSTASAVPTSGLTSSSEIRLHLIGGLLVRSFGPWHTSLYNSLDFDFIMSDLPLASLSTWQSFWPRVQADTYTPLLAPGE